MLPAQAQIVPDGTLPQGSIVLDHETGIDISGGTIAGANLFHSFEQFGLRDGDRATFSSPVGIERILARVTGNAIAEIDGILSANADLIFLAPHGIHFGDQAHLDLNGSLIATTANALQFSDGMTWPVSPTPSPALLSVNVPIGLQFEDTIAPGLISAMGGEQVISISSPASSLNFLATLPTDAMSPSPSETVLATAPGHTLSLIGGAIDLRRIQLNALNGAIVLGALQSGNVALTPHATAPGWDIDVQAAVQAAPMGGLIQLSDRAALTASGLPNGTITLAAETILVNGGAFTQLQNAGLEPGGDLTLRATDTITIEGRSQEGQGSFLSTETFGTGQGGAIRVSTDRLDLVNGAGMNTLSYGVGHSGSIRLGIQGQASILGSEPDRLGEISNVGTVALGTGPGGDLEITADRLTLGQGGTIVTLTTGLGDSGNIAINANDQIQLQGSESGNQGSTIGTATLGLGTAGHVTIQTPQLSLLDGARVGSLSIAAGNAGNVTLNSPTAILLRGQDPTLGGSSIVSSVESILTSTLLPRTFQALLPNVETIVPTGNSGNLSITTPLLQVEHAGSIQVANRGFGIPGRLTVTGDTLRLTSNGAIAAQTVTGSGGVIDLNLRRLEVLNGSISTATVSTGRGSDVRIRASEQVLVSANSLEDTQAQSFNLFFSNTAIPTFNTGIVSGSVGQGRAGDIEIETGQLTLQNGGLITPAALRSGDAGRLTLRVTGDILMDSGILSTATLSQASDAGRGGDILIDANNLTLINGGNISTTTLGHNNAGQLQINIRDRLLIIGSDRASLFSTSGLSSGTLNLGVGSIGNGGDMSITAHNLVLQDRAGISASSEGQGNAGDIDLNVDRLLLDDNAFIIATSNSGEGGNLSIQANSSTVVQNQSQLSTQAGSAVTGGGNGGNVRLRTGVFAAIDHSEISANAFRGSGGQITIDTRGFFLDDRSTIDASSQVGIDGVVAINNDTIVTDPNIVSLSSELLTHNLLEQDCAASNRDRFAVINYGRTLGQFDRTLDITPSWADDRDWRDLMPPHSTDRPILAPTPNLNPVPDPAPALNPAFNPELTPSQNPNQAPNQNPIPDIIEANSLHYDPSSPPQLQHDPTLIQGEQSPLRCRESLPSSVTPSAMSSSVTPSAMSSSVSSMASAMPLPVTPSAISSLSVPSSVPLSVPSAMSSNSR